MNHAMVGHVGLGGEALVAEVALVGFHVGVQCQMVLQGDLGEQQLVTDGALETGAKGRPRWCPPSRGVQLRCRVRLAVGEHFAQCVERQAACHASVEKKCQGSDRVLVFFLMCGCIFHRGRLEPPIKRSFVY